MGVDIFSENERAVILSLMRNPEHTDTQISSSMGMNLFTFNKIKNSLVRRDMLKKYYVPNYGRLGMEILAVTHGGSMDLFSEKEKDHGDAERYPDMSIFGMMEDNSGIIFHVISDFTDLKRLMRTKENQLGKVVHNLRPVNNSLFSLRDLRIERFFDVQGLLEEEIGSRAVPRLDPETPAQKAAFESWSGFFHMSKNVEMIGPDLFRTFLEIVKNPDSKENHLMSRLGISRYRFRKMKDQLLEEGFIKPLYVTNVMGLGYDVLIFTHMRFRAGQDPRKLFKTYEDRMPSNLMIMAFDHTEAVGLGIFRNLTEGSRAQTSMRRAMLDRGFLEGEPDIRIFSLPNCRDWPPLSFHNPIAEKGRIADPHGIQGV